jgi:hypothetical protein
MTRDIFKIAAESLVMVCLPQLGLGQNSGYHYSTGSNRVVNQGQLGMPGPSSTYIGPGTMSQTARGMSPNASSLPTSHWGSVVGTGGDCTYAATEKQGHDQTVRTNTLPLASPTTNPSVSKQSSDVRYVVRRGKRGRLYYVPVQNMRQKAPGHLYKPTGPATYGDASPVSSGPINY